MRKLMLLVGLCMLGVLAFGAVAGAENHDVTVGPVEPLTALPTATAPADDQYQPGPVEPLTAAPGDATGGTDALPETGGLTALSLAALGLLVVGGLLSARLIRR